MTRRDRILHLAARGLVNNAPCPVVVPPVAVVAMAEEAAPKKSKRKAVKRK